MVEHLEAVDVVVLTKNSEDMLDKCLSSVYENVPVKRLIIVDGFSTDGTLKIINEFDKIYGNVKVISERGTRAVARTRGIKEVETSWFMFVDSDVILGRDWFRNARRHIDESTGAVWGLNIDVIPKVKSRLFYRSLAVVAKACFNIRGGMHDTLIRSDLVKDIRIPEELHAYEDAYIIDWIKKKNCRVQIGDDMSCLHLRPQSDWNLKESISLAATEVRCGIFHAHAVKYIFFYPFFAVFWVLQVLGKGHGNLPGHSPLRFLNTGLTRDQFRAILKIYPLAGSPTTSISERT